MRPRNGFIKISRSWGGGRRISGRQLNTPGTGDDSRKILSQGWVSQQGQNPHPSQRAASNPWVHLNWVKIMLWSIKVKKKKKKKAGVAISKVFHPSSLCFSNLVLGTTLDSFSTPLLLLWGPGFREPHLWVRTHPQGPALPIPSSLLSLPLSSSEDKQDWENSKFFCKRLFWVLTIYIWLLALQKGKTKITMWFSNWHCTAKIFYLFLEWNVSRKNDFFSTGVFPFQTPDFSNVDNPRFPVKNQDKWDPLRIFWEDK